jgi:NADH:ubiquinone oxidoreductase subunit 6 (subunit J)
MIFLYFIVLNCIFFNLLSLVSPIDYMTRLALLISVFVLSGILYMLIDFKFLGLTYMIVYVGAISILFLFVIMMTESGRTPNLAVQPLSKGTITLFRESGLRLDLSLLVGGLIISLIYGQPILSDYVNNFVSSEMDIMYFFTPDYTTTIVTMTDIETLGMVLYLNYPFIIIVLGILLWVTLIGILKISLK